MELMLEIVRCAPFYLAWLIGAFVLCSAAEWALRRNVK